ncbi:kinase [Micromonospora sp. CA-246542]|uniref:kinase n=1 Tax=Micromonospora sp. CA-246542 TaxID=3239959 RepID=UPI003D8B79ED
MDQAAPTGNSETILISIRGNSSAGKSTIATALRRRHGRGCAMVGQDHIRRILLRERDKPGGLAPALIAQNVRFCLDHGYHVILEGIMHTARYRSMLTELRDAHRGRTLFAYLDVSLPETLRRHETRPLAAEVSPENLRSWYTPRDVLGWPDELVLPETTTLEQAIERIATVAGLPLTGRDNDLLPAVP